MAITQSQAVGPYKKPPGFYQTTAMNAQLPYLNSIIAAEQAQKQQKQATQMAQNQMDFQQQMQEEQMQQQKESQMTQMGLQAGQLGLNLATGPTGQKNITSLFGGAQGTVAPSWQQDWMGGLNVANTLGAGLTGLGVGMMTNKKGAKLGLGALAGGLTGLLGAGAGYGLESAISGGIMGGLGGLASSLF